MKTLSKRTLFLSLALIFALPVAFSAPIKGLKISILKKGKGAEVKKGETAKVHYTGWLMNGKKFDSSKDHGQPFEFSVGGGSVIKGWDLGVEGMKVGEVRQLIIDSDLAYGKTGAGGAIPPNSKLKFDIELLSISKNAAP
jgi:FKBP-type peptidyl-prolyl cis-trans isomerase